MASDAFLLIDVMMFSPPRRSSTKVKHKLHKITEVLQPPKISATTSRKKFEKMWKIIHSKLEQISIVLCKPLVNQGEQMANVH